MHKKLSLCISICNIFMYNLYVHIYPGILGYLERGAFQFHPISPDLKIEDVNIYFSEAF